MCQRADTLQTHPFAPGPGDSHRPAASVRETQCCELTIMYGLSNVVRLTCGTLYPCYASWKAIKVNDGPEIERWIMFWSVLGCVSLAEQTVEWTVNWLPLYTQAKTLVMLWLTLPSIQGTTYVYVTYLGPFLESHEKDIDTALVETKARARAAGLGYLKSAYAAVKDMLASSVGAAAMAAADQSPPAGPQGAVTQTQPPPTVHDPMAGPASQAWSYANTLIRQYGPAAIAAGSAVLHPMQGREPGVASASQGSPSRSDTLTDRRLTGSRGAKNELLEMDSRTAESYLPRPASTSLLRSSRRLSDLPSSQPPSASSIEHSFVGGQRFEEISPDEAAAEEQSQKKKLATGWWFRQPTPVKAKSS